MSRKIRALIIEDERLARRELRVLLSKHTEVEIVGEAETIEQAVRLIQTERPNAIFLDIQLAGETGFDLFEQISPTEFKTIFVTAFDAFAIRAFEVNALDYLLKPVNPERLAKAIERLAEERDEEKTGEKTDLRPLEFDDRIFLQTGSRSIFLKIKTISYILAAGDYSEVFTADGQKILAEKPLREWEERLPEKHFTRIHRTCIINLECVERVESWFNRSYRIYLENAKEPFAVSRRYAAKLKLKFG